MQKIKKIATWSISLLLLVLTFSFTESMYFKHTCKAIEVVLTDSADNYFIQKQDIINLVSPSGKTDGYVLHQLNIAELEHKIEKYPSVKNVDVYKTIDGKLRIELEQRKPLIRVITSKGQNYYIDTEGAIMPLSEKYSSRVLVVNGNIRLNFKLENSFNILEQKDVNQKHKLKILVDLFELANFIARNQFWNAQIEQIYVNKQNELELIPRVGSHIIFFGDASNYEIKFRNLSALYEKGLSRIGWNKYKYINLKYINQVVCTKK